MLNMALRCLEGSTMSNLVHRRRRCARIDPHSILLPGGQYARGWVGLSLFIALRWMQRPERVMVGLAENIQACLRDFQTGTASMARKRHLVSSARGLLCFCLMTHRTYPFYPFNPWWKREPILWRTALQAEASL